MYNYPPYGPRGAESEREDFWTDIPEGNDMLPGVLPGMLPGALPGTLGGAQHAGPDPQTAADGGEPYCPQCPNADDPALQPDADHNDAGLPEELSELDALDDTLM